MTLCLKNKKKKIAIHKIIVVLSSYKRLTEVYPTKGWLKNKNTFTQDDENLQSGTTITRHVFFLYYLDHKAFNTPPKV